MILLGFKTLILPKHDICAKYHNTEKISTIVFKEGFGSNFEFLCVRCHHFILLRLSLNNCAIMPIQTSPNQAHYSIFFTLDHSIGSSDFFVNYFVSDTKFYESSKIIS